MAQTSPERPADADDPLVAAVYSLYSLRHPQSFRAWAARVALLAVLILGAVNGVADSVFQATRFEAMMWLSDTCPKAFHRLVGVSIFGSIFLLPVIPVVLGIVSRRRHGGILQADVTIATILVHFGLLAWAFFFSKPSPHPYYWITCPYLLGPFLGNAIIAIVRMPFVGRDWSSILVASLTLLSTFFFYGFCVALVWIAGVGA